MIGYNTIIYRININYIMSVRSKELVINVRFYVFIENCLKYEFNYKICMTKDFFRIEFAVAGSLYRAHASSFIYLSEQFFLAFDNNKQNKLVNNIW